jgi:hypothetical protein
MADCVHLWLEGDNTCRYCGVKVPLPPAIRGLCTCGARTRTCSTIEEVDASAIEDGWEVRPGTEPGKFRCPACIESKGHIGTIDPSKPLTIGFKGYRIIKPKGVKK